MEDGASAALPGLKYLEVWCHCHSSRHLSDMSNKVMSGGGHKSGIATDVTGKGDSSALRLGNKSYLVWLQLSWLVKDCSTAERWFSCSAARAAGALGMMLQDICARQDGTPCCRQWD